MVGLSKIQIKIQRKDAQYLMSLYEKAVEYYSAVNNQKFIDITHKIHQLLINTQLNTSSSDETAKKEIEADNGNLDCCS